MPTNTASKATAPRMRSTSDASAASASGMAGVSSSLIEVSLKDQLRGDFVSMRSPFAPAPRLIQLVLCKLGGPAFVYERDRQVESAAEIGRETLRLRRHRMRRAIRMQWQADDELVRLPFVHERADHRHHRRRAGGNRHQRLA